MQRGTGRRRSPQDKKRLSLDRDRRNAYWENDKSSRKNIPRAKARVNRANRRLDATALAGALGPADEALEVRAQEGVESRRRKQWRKTPDEPLRRTLARRSGADVDLPWDPSRR